MKATGRTVGFILPGVGISGGIHIVLRWAQALAKAGDIVFVIAPGAPHVLEWPFLQGERLGFVAIEPDDARHVRFDVLFATWWETLCELPGYQSRSYAFLAQALEEQFYPYRSVAQREYGMLVDSGIEVVCIAHWLRDHLVHSYHVDPGRMQVILNPLDKGRWRPTAPLVQKGSNPRFLVEGRDSEPRKNVVRTMELLDAAGAEYLWVGANVDRTRAGRGCVRVLEDVPYADMPRVYASCDVLVKLSDAEGMFGPPLEMFSTGGTAIAWAVPGADEYMTHRYNSLLLPMHSDEAVVEAVELLVHDRGLLARLCEGAMATVRGWPTWEDYEGRIVDLVHSLPPNDVALLAGRAAMVQARRALAAATEVSPPEPISKTKATGGGNARSR